LILALITCGEAHADAKQRSYQHGRWRWELGLGLAGESHDTQGLRRIDDGPGNAVLDVEPGLLLQAACGWEVARGVFLRGGIDTAGFSIGDIFGSYTPDPEPSFSGGFKVAEVRWTAIRLEALWLLDLSDRKRAGLFAGASWNHIGSIQVTPAAYSDYELTSVSSTDRFTGLFGGDWLWRLGGSQWSLGFSGTWNFGAGAEVRFETDPTSPYNSGSVSIRPWSVSLRLSHVPR
jgi:hypothetical protein